MKMSCNGCRVLRKGCSDNCTIRPCLQWIKNPESQANATVFLAKFYGRAGLLNLINSGPEHHRPAIFRSLLYESCGRIVNPIYGSVGLLWSGSWQLCQQAVEAVLKGAPIVQIPSETAASAAAPPLKACDIRHVSKVNKNKTKFKRSGTKSRLAKLPSQTLDAGVENLGLFNCCEAEKEIEESMVSADDTAEEASHVSQGDQANNEAEESKVELELTLGFEPVSRTAPAERPVAQARCDLRGLVGDGCRIDLGL